MFANTFQTGFISIFYSVGSNPLQLWDKQVKNGHIRRVVDEEVRSLVLEISGTNVATTYITCPIKPRVSLGIKLPFLVMIIKNMKKYFTFEIQILDDKDMHRRFRVSNFQSTTKVRPFCTTMPIGLSSGWNQVQFNLADFTKRAYGSTYMETTRVQIHANVRIRRIYFSDMLYSDEELPNEYKLFVPTTGTAVSHKSNGQKKDSVSKEKKETRKSSVEVTEVPPIVQELPSAAPPSPSELGEQPPPTTPTETGTFTETTEPQTVKEDEPTTEGEATDRTTTTLTELVSEPPPENQGEELPEEPVDQAPVEEVPLETEQIPADEGAAPAKEGVALTEEVPAEQPPVEVEEVPAAMEEAPLETVEEPVVAEETPIEQTEEPPIEQTEEPSVEQTEEPAAKQTEEPPMEQTEELPPAEEPLAEEKPVETTE